MNNTLKTVLKALLTAVIVAAVLIFVFAFAAQKMGDPSKYLPSLGTAAFIASALAGGICAKRQHGGNIFFAPLIFCGAYILICYAASLAMGRGSGGGVRTLLTYAGAVLASLVGAIIGTNRKDKKSKNLKKYKKYSKA